MNAPINIQILNGPDGRPAFVVIPYDDFISQQAGVQELIPHAVINSVVRGDTPLRAWREHLGLTQNEMARRLGISQSAYAQHENKTQLRKPTMEKLATALGISAEQLNF